MSGYIGNIPTPQATQSRQSFTATASQTTFATVGYTAGFLDVYLNGVHLLDGTDYTATNGSDIVLTVGAALDDVVEFVAYETFSVSDQSFTGTTTVDVLDVTGAATGTDLTLSGGVYLGGTGAANYLDDYEEGTFTGTITPATSGSVSLSGVLNEMTYVKVGSLVTVVGFLYVGSTSSPSGIQVDLPLPFAIANLTDQAARGGTCAMWRRNATGVRATVPLYFLEGNSTFQLVINASTIGANDEFSFSFSYRTAA